MQYVNEQITWNSWWHVTVNLNMYDKRPRLSRLSLFPLKLDSQSQKTRPNWHQTALAVTSTNPDCMDDLTWSHFELEIP